MGGGGKTTTVDMTNKGYSGLSAPQTDDDLLGTYRKALGQNMSGFAGNDYDSRQQEQEERLRRMMED